MDFLLLGLVLLALLLVATCVSLFAQINKLRSGTLQGVEERVAAQTKQQRLEADNTALRAERDNLRSEREQALEAQRGAEKREALALQKIQDFETQREQLTLAAKEAVVKAGAELSNKLLADHKREAEAVKKETEERTQKVTGELMQHFQQITQTVGHLQAQAKASMEKTDTLYRALSTPGGVGQHAEIGLENALKNLGLRVGQDFVMQYNAASDEAGRLRPDVVIFLPQGRVLAVDSKASKHLLTYAEAPDEAARIAALESLKRSMNTHLNALASKDYSTAIEARYREAGRSGEITQIFNVMCLQNEAAFEHLRRADPEFEQKAERKSMILTNPAGLSAMFSIAKMDINLERQAENQTHIIDQVKRLVDALHIVIDHAAKMGRGLKTAADGFSEFTRSVNRTLIPRIATLDKMGVAAPKNKGVPKPLASYYLTQADDVLSLEHDSEEGVMLELLVNKADG